MKSLETWRILRSRGLFIYLLIAILGFAFSGRWGWMAIASMILTYVIFDLIGHEAVPEDENHVKLIKPLQSYRILQFMFSIALIVNMTVLYSVFLMIKVIVLWWFGLCDLLYYLIGRYPLKKNDGTSIEWDWMGWTPWGIIKRKRKYLTSREIVIQAILGTVIVIILTIFGV
jgi:hypothetical protein